MKLSSRVYKYNILKYIAPVRMYDPVKCSS